MRKKVGRNLVLTVGYDDHGKNFNLWDSGKIRIHPYCYWILKLMKSLQLVERTNLLLCEIFIINKTELLLSSLKQLIKFM
jgi:hypothetical protein